MFFILFFCYVTVGLTALQFISPSVTLLNHYPHPLHTTPTPSPTDSIGRGEPMYLVILFPTPGKLQRLLEKLLFFFQQRKNFFHFLVPFYRRPLPQDTKEKGSWAHLHKGAGNFEKKSSGSPDSVCQSLRRCRLSFEAMYVFFTHSSIFIAFGHALKRLFYYKVILKSIIF